jgi:hypothetical protein
MLEVELDIFSGMPNPTWLLPEESEGSLYELLSADAGQISPVAAIEDNLGLGYRGLIVRRIKTDDGVWDQAQAARGEPFPNEFRVGPRLARGDSVAEWLLTTAERRDVRLDDELMEVVSRGVVLVPTLDGPKEPTEEFDPEAVEEAEVAVDVPREPDVGEHETWWACGSNYFSANAHLFNHPDHITRNNCYCFASNHMPDIRYALPGKRGGAPATSITCDGVIAGLMADGWTPGCQQNSLTIALVVWPHYDYHFYRLVTGGPFWWWGHKPGGTKAKYTDDCGHPIYQYMGKGYAPNNICRGAYVDFCDYFYQNNWTAYVA